MKSLLTIFFTLTLFYSYGQTDNLLQQMIDSIKTQQQVRTSPTPNRDIKERTEEVRAVKKDTVKVAKKKDVTKITTVSFDSSTVNNKDRQVAKDLSEANHNSSTAPDIVKKPVKWQEDTAFIKLLKIPSANKTSVSVFYDGDIRIRQQKDYLFYALTGVVLLLAVIKQLFPKYFADMFYLMFQASFRQKQTREMLMQAKLPSLLMNVLFIVVGGLFLGLIADIYKVNVLRWDSEPFWSLVVYSITFLALMYTCKYLVIQFIGWAFNVSEQTSTYSFIVFLINKIIGLTLLPLLLLLSFSSGQMQQMIITVACYLTGFMVLIRYIVSLTIIRGTLSIHPIHFFIYLCAVELMPVLIIYKILLNYLGKS